MNEFNLKISTPDGDAFNDKAVFMSLRGAEGDLAVMAGHVPFTTTVKSGLCKIETLDSAGSFKGVIPGGLLTVAKEGVTLICGSFKRD